MNDPIKAKIEKQHRRDFKTLLRILTFNGKLITSYQLWISIIISIAFIIIIYLYKIDAYTVLLEINNRLLDVLPNILGFNLGAYVLFVSLNSEKTMNGLVEPSDSEFTTFQEISSVFAWSILIQAIALIIAFITAIIMSLELSSQFYNIINIGALVLTLPISVYSILLIYRIVMNVFTISQVIHFFTTISKLEKSEQNENKG